MSVTLGDVSLTSEDLDTLAPRCFLSDLIIAYAFQCIAESQSQSSHRFVQPASVFMAACGVAGADLAAILHQLHLDTADVVYLPVNNNDQPDRAYGGSHWSLLQFRRATNSIHHYDSYGGHNEAVARRIAAAFSVALGAQQQPAFVVESAAPQQSNSFDCGIFVICVTEALERANDDVPAALADVARRSKTRRAELLAALHEAIAHKQAARENAKQKATTLVS
jgi:sentrin-specific protease 8